MSHGKEGKGTVVGKYAQSMGRRGVCWTDGTFVLLRRKRKRRCKARGAESAKSDQKAVEGIFAFSSVSPCRDRVAGGRIFGSASFLLPVIPYADRADCADLAGDGVRNGNRDHGDRNENT